MKTIFCFVFMLLMLACSCAGYYGVMHNSGDNYADTIIVRNLWGITVYRVQGATYSYYEGCLVVDGHIFCPEKGYSWRIY